MTCQSALELLLDAEPGELAATGATPLGEHLRGCARCRRVAAQLMQDTQQLSLALAAVPSRRRPVRVRQLVLVPVMAMATLVFAILWPAAPVPSPVVPDVPRVIPQPPQAVVPAATPDVRKAVPRSVSPVGRAFARAVPLAPVRLEPSGAPASQLSVETSGVTVTPAPGTRATVMHTSNAKLLVVWLY